jgi:hypothetical protein
MPIDHARLLQLRLVVARYGEMDRMGWWNTSGALGGMGKVVYGRGFPRTAPFAAARAVFAVARARTRELWNPVGCATLWSLPLEVEDAFEDHWQGWTADVATWRPIFEALASLRGADLVEDLRALGAIDAATERDARDLRRSAETRAVLLPGIRAVDDATLGLLAAGFARGEKGQLAVPYARLEA